MQIEIAHHDRNPLCDHTVRVYLLENGLFRWSHENTKKEYYDVSLEKLLSDKNLKALIWEPIVK